MLCFSVMVISKAGIASVIALLTLQLIVIWHALPRKYPLSLHQTLETSQRIRAAASSIVSVGNADMLKTQNGNTQENLGLMIGKPIVINKSQSTKVANKSTHQNHFKTDSNSSTAAVHDHVPKYPPIKPDTPSSNKSRTNVTSNKKNWKRDTFCHNFFSDTFQLSAPVCSTSSNSLPKSVECIGSPHSQSMATCILRNVMISPSLFLKALSDADYPDFDNNDHSLALLEGAGTECVEMTSDNLAQRVESGDYVLRVVNELRDEARQHTSSCDVWINETVFFFTAHRFHIYFRFLDYFNMHKLLEDMRRHTSTSGYRIIRISGSDGYNFQDFDHDLFPEVKVQTLDDLEDKKTCFKKVILVPKSYASPIFQCKNHVTLRAKCLLCDGKGLTGTQIHSFKERVLSACAINHKLPSKRNDSKLVIVVSRRPYKRGRNSNNDDFERVMDNEDSLTQEIKSTFTNTNVELVHLENLSLCDQIAHGHNADVFLGVHGSGLVHLWWMREEALVFEMEPHYEIGNPTFRMLSRLAGQRYHSEAIGGGWKTVHVNIPSIIKSMKKFATL